VYPQHHIQRIGAAAIAGLGAVTGNLLLQTLPRYQGIHLFKKLLPAGFAFHVVVFRFSKTELIHFQYAIYFREVLSYFTGLDQMFTR
jgi:hypothetical protein